LKKELEKPIIVVVTVFSVIVVIFAALQASGIFFPEQTRSIIGSRLTILKAYSTDKQTLFAEVKCLNANATLTQAIIRYETGTTTVTSILSDKILEGETKTLKINLNVVLIPGNYNMTLRTLDGGSFVSPEFTVP
jgi:hypothetical protein